MKNSQMNTFKESLKIYPIDVWKFMYTFFSQKFEPFWENPGKKINLLESKGKKNTIAITLLTH
jgi:hypothetical protein